MFAHVLKAHCFAEQDDKIRKLLDTTVTGKAAVFEKTQGMKYLLAVSILFPYRIRDSQGHYNMMPQMMSKGRDVSEFYSSVVRNVIVSSCCNFPLL